MGKTIAKLDMRALMDTMTEDAQSGIVIDEQGLMHISGFTLSPRGIAAVDEVTDEQFQTFGTVLRSVNKALQFAIGDYCNLAVVRYGDGQREALAEWFGIEVRTIYDYSYVARAVEFSIRIENLGFGHHQVIAAMSPELQAQWLQTAEANRWSVAKLRAAIKKANLPAGVDDDKPVLTKTMKQAKIDTLYVFDQTVYEGWRESAAIRAEVKQRAERLAQFYTNLAKQC